MHGTCKTRSSFFFDDKAEVPMCKSVSVEVDEHVEKLVRGAHVA